MSATLSSHAVLIAYWVVMLVICAFFLRMACSLCRVDLPSWRRSFVAVVVVAFLAYLTFDFTAYLVMRSMSDVLIRVPEGYGYNYWFREPFALKWLIITHAGPLRYLPFVFGLCAAGVLQVIVLQAEVTFRFGLVIAALQWGATAVAGYVVALLFGVALSGVGWQPPQPEPPQQAQAQPPAGPAAPPRGRRALASRNKARAKKAATATPPTEATAEAPAAREPTALEVAQQKAESAGRTAQEQLRDVGENLAVLANFQQTAHKAMGVQHPNVGRIVDTGEAHGFYYLVKEHYEGPTLEEILERRGKLPYPQAARLPAQVLAGLEALHGAGVPAGDLAADCIQLAPAGKGQPNQRTVKILHAGPRRRLFDETAIGRSISLVQGIPDELELSSSCTFELEVGEASAPAPAEDIFRVGRLFYRCVTGAAPFPEKGLVPDRPAKPVCEAAPEVPEMLGRVIDEMIDPTPAKRPQKAAHVAKSLRVFLAAEEHGREAKPEENIAAPAAVAATVAEEEPVDEEAAAEEEGVEEEEAAPVPRARKKVLAHDATWWDKVVATYQEVHPEVRDLVFLASGALLMLALIFLVEFLTGLHLSYVAGLATGAVASYFVEMYVRWRREKKVGLS